MSFRQNISWLVSFSMALFLGYPAAAEGFKVYISTDMEGCSGVTCSKQVAGEKGKQLTAVPFVADPGSPLLGTSRAEGQKGKI